MANLPLQCGFCKQQGLFTPLVVRVDGEGHLMFCPWHPEIVWPVKILPSHKSS
jgi:hypothetical protein